MTLLPTRYERIVAQLPSEPLVDHLVNIFFSQGNWYFCLLDQPYFEELRLIWRLHHAGSGWSVTGTRNPETQRIFIPDLAEVRYYPALLLQIMALALHFLPMESPIRNQLQLHDNVAIDQLSKRYSTMGHELMTLLDRVNPTITGVLTDLLRGAWLKNSGFGSHSWLALSDAVRQAHSLELHVHVDGSRYRSSDTTIITLWHEEHRRRVWTRVFVWDAQMSLALGRTRMINPRDCSVLRPLDCDIPPNPLQVTPASCVNASRPSMFTNQLYSFSIAYKVHEAIDAGILNSSCEDYSVINKLHYDVLQLAQDLPQTFQSDNADTSWDFEYRYIPRQRQQIAMVTNSFLMALHKPFAAHWPPSRASGVSAALRTLSAQQRLFELCDEHHHKIYSLAFNTIDASVFLTSMVLTWSQSDIPLQVAGDIVLPMQEIRLGLQEAVDRFTQMQQRSNVAMQGTKVLQRCVQLVTEVETTVCMAEQSGQLSISGQDGGYGTQAAMSTSELQQCGLGQQDYVPRPTPQQSFNLSKSFSQVIGQDWNENMSATPPKLAMWLEQNSFFDSCMLTHTNASSQDWWQ